MSAMQFVLWACITQASIWGASGHGMTGALWAVAALCVAITDWRSK